MIQSLFEIEEPKKKPLILEKKLAEENKQVRFSNSSADIREKQKSND